MFVFRVLVLGAAGGAACTASGGDINPKQTTLGSEQPIFFPTGLAIAPDDSVLFVASANSELRYNSGSINVVDLAKVDGVIDDWLGAQVIPADCAPDTDHREALVCSVQDAFLRIGAGARVGNFATDIAIQEQTSGNLRLIVPTRGDPSITWVDYSATGGLSCTENAGAFALCDDAHRLTYVHNDPNLAPLPDEPFNVFADSVNGFAVVTHLSTGAVTLVQSPRDGKAAVIADVVGGIFAPDTTTGLRGSTGVAGRSPSGINDMVYVGSRSEDRIQTFTVAHPPNESYGDPMHENVFPFLLTGSYFFLDAVGGNSGSSTDTRGMAFSPNGDRMYLVNRNPPSLQIFDTELTIQGTPANVYIGGTDLCREASTLTILDPGDGERAYVTCFQDGQIYVVDPRGGGVAEDIITVGRGPYSVVSSASRQKLYVTNFLEDTIAVVDVAPGSPTRNRVVLRIGKPKAL